VKNKGVRSRKMKIILSLTITAFWDITPCNPVSMHRISRRKVCLIVNDDQQDANILAYLFMPNQLYMFRALSSPITRSTWLYLQPLLLSTGIAVGWCHGWDGTAVPSHPWYQPTAISVDNIRCCKYSQVLLIMSEDIARNMLSWLGIN